jgi:hypothetical protein
MVPRLVVLALAAFSLSAQPSPVPGWILAGTKVKQYTIALDHEVVHGGKFSATLRCVSPKCTDYGTLAQSLHTQIFLGRRVRFTAWVKARNAGAANLWMRVDGSDGEYLSFDNMGDHRKHGTFDWKKMSIVLDVLPPGTLIHYGLLLGGDGQAWIDDASVEPVDPEKVKSTNMLYSPTFANAGREPMTDATSSVHLRPFNLDFELER